MRTQEILLNAAYKEVEVIKNIFLSFVEKSKKGDSNLRITFKTYTKNDSVGIIYKGHSLLLKFHTKYDDSIEGAYLQVRLIKGVLNEEGKGDIFSLLKEIVPKKRYVFYFQSEMGWREKDELERLYLSQDVAEEWLKIFEEKFEKF